MSEHESRRREPAFSSHVADCRPGPSLRLPASFVNGVPQREGTDYIVRDGWLVFERPMKEEGKLGLMRWASITLGIAGSYRQNDSVDVAYERDGRKVVAAKIPVEPFD